MRLCDLLKHIMDNFLIEIYDNKEIVKTGNTNELNNEHFSSFNPLEGFKNHLWEKEVKDIIIKKGNIKIFV